MDNSAAAAGVPASVSRQKNCNSCVQGKRRCDRRTPACSRCARKKLLCVYGKALVTPSTETVPLGSPAYSAFTPNLSLDLGFENFGNLPLDFQPSITAEQTPQPVRVMDASGSSDVSMTNFMDLINNNISSSPDQWLVPVNNANAPVPERPSTPADEDTVRAYDKMASFCVSPARPPSTRRCSRAPCLFHAYNHLQRDMEPWQRHDGACRRDDRVPLLHRRALGRAVGL